LVAVGFSVGFARAADPISQQTPVRILELNKLTFSEKIPVVSGLAIDSTGKLLATVGDDHVLRIWSLDNGSVLYRFAAHSDWIKAVSFQPDGKALATAGNDRRIRFWEIAAGAVPRELPQEPQAIGALVYSPDGKYLASAGFGDKVRLYTSDGRLVREFDAPGSDMSALVFSPDAVQLAAAGRLGLIRIWNVAGGTNVLDIQGSSRRICALAYSPSGKQLAAAGHERTIRLFDPVSGKTLASLPPTATKIASLCFCGEKLLAAGGTDDVIRLCNLSTNTEQSQLLGHTGTVDTLAYNPQNKTLISGGFDTTVRVWQITSEPEGITQR
ncbi:MAG TPA: WD40 repeat domain-containing protein, partial [Thermoguttaceae bacterium]